MRLGSFVRFAALVMLSVCSLGLRAPHANPTAQSWNEVLSNDGSWRVRWRLLMDHREVELPTPRRRFTIELKLESLRSPAETPRAVTVDAQMPEHGHGMNVAPLVTVERGGAVSADGMLFHMTGRWEVDVDIDDGNTVERAQWNIGMY